ncbi:Phage terminase-like protein, large subunit, contains N-terminal HTH domain [Rhizobiales bacterium GAS113]|nr:Phage terminase-like protein, large subunit, contains N-terminal HTH domain [Rhizobiales bacterium GAS113]
MTPIVTMRAALSDPALLGTALPGASWRAWRVLLIAMMGEPLDAEEREIFTKLTGREHEPGQRVEEFWGVIGRRGGKSRAIATLIVYVTCLCSHDDAKAVGETLIALCLAQNQKQAAVILGYVRGLFESIEMFAALISTVTADAITLTNGIEIQIRAASFRGLRGITCVLAVADEIAYWRTESTSLNPDREIVAAVRPTLATTGGIFAGISSPYAESGELFEAYKRDFGPEGDPLILVAQGSSKDLNPSLPQKVIDRAYERDPANAAAEYGAVFRSDLTAFLSLSLIEAAVDAGVAVRPPRDGITYFGYIDAASGTGKDSFACGIAHAEGDVAVLDCLAERRPPFDPAAVTREICELLKSYRVHAVRGDKYAAGFVQTAFEKCGVSYRYSDIDSSQTYLETIPLFTSGRVRLIDGKRLVQQLASLERRTSSTGRDRVDHPASAHAHDDVAMAAAGSLVLAAAPKRQQKHFPSSGGDGVLIEGIPRSNNGVPTNTYASYDIAGGDASAPPGGW